MTINFIKDKILEPITSAADFFHIWSTIEGIMENIGLPMWMATIISEIIAIIIIAAIILIPGAFITWIIKKFKKF